jgi:transposase
MRGDDFEQTGMFSYLMPEQRIPADHPLRPLRKMVDAVLKELSPQFAPLYAKTGRPSIPPEQLLRTQVLQMLYSVRSERLLMEQLEYNLLFRWFVGLSMDDAVWDVTVFTKNRERLLNGEVAQAFFTRVVHYAHERGLVSDEHFTVDGTLIQAWAGQKSFQPKAEEERRPPSDDDPSNPTVDFRGEKRCNDTHQSTTDPEARLVKKAAGQEAKLCYHGHVVTENRNGIVVGAQVTIATGKAERETAVTLMEQVPRHRRATLGADKNYDTSECVQQLRAQGVTPHVAQNDTNRASAIDGRTTRHAGYAVSQRKRKRVEEFFGWLKTVAVMRQTRHRGQARVTGCSHWPARCTTWCAFAT